MNAPDSQPDAPRPAAGPSDDAAARLAPCVRALAAWAEPGADGRVEIVHTPCSLVVLTPSHAFKIKKAVNLGYLDFRAADLRRKLCHAELTLNAPLAPGVYQRVLRLVPRSNGDDGPPRVDVDDAAEPAPAGAEFAVQMRRIPRGSMLETRLSGPPGPRPTQGSDGLPERLDALADRLAAFHAVAPSGDDVSTHARPDRLHADARRNLDELHAVLAAAPIDDAGLWPRLERWTDAQAGPGGVLTARLAARLSEHPARIREGHGDLHAGNIAFDDAAAAPDNPRGVLVYDRLEFRRDFRCRDVAAEVACVAMSLDACGRPDLAEGFVASYERASGDAGVTALQPFYRLYYALVRAKVAALRAMAGAPASGGGTRDDAAGRAALDADSEHALDAAREHLALAAGYALGPALVLMCGLPGSGKSFVGRPLARALRAGVHRADEVRKTLAGLAPTDRGGPELYSAAMSQRTYEALLDRAAADLRGRRASVVDATFRSAQLRAPLLALARRCGVPALIVHCHASEDETRRRLLARAASGDDASDADWAVYQRMAPTFEPPSGAEAPVLRTPEHGAAWRCVQAALATLLDAAAGLAPGAADDPGADPVGS